MDGGIEETSKSRKRKPRGGIKKAALAYLEKHGRGKAIEIAKLSGLKVTSVNQTLFGLKKAGRVKQAKKRGSPFVLEEVREFIPAQPTDHPTSI